MKQHDDDPCPEFMPCIGIFTVNKDNVYQCASPNQFDWLRRNGWSVPHLDSK